MASSRASFRVALLKLIFLCEESPFHGEIFRNRSHIIPHSKSVRFYEGFLTWTIEIDPPPLRVHQTVIFSKAKLQHEPWA